MSGGDAVGHHLVFFSWFLESSLEAKLLQWMEFGKDKSWVIGQALAIEFGTPSLELTWFIMFHIGELSEASQLPSSFLAVFLGIAWKNEWQRRLTQLNEICIIVALT